MESLRTKTRSDGKPYTLRENKDRFFFPDEYMKFEMALKPKQVFSVKCLINTGARINEMQNVKVHDCDLVNNRITLRVTKSKAKKGEKKGHGKPRIISISSQFAKYLRKHIRENNLSNEDYLGVLSNAALNIAYKKAGEKSGMNDYHNIASHTFRKTHGNWLKALNVDAGEICTRLGHDYNTFLSSYSSPDIFNYKDRQDIKIILGDLMQERMR